MTYRQDDFNFSRVSEAIAYIVGNYQQQPSLFDISERVNVSPYHFQRLFTEWAGVSPKKFLQYISVAHAKQVLKEQQGTLFDAAYEAGLSGTGRLHELFVKVEGMTPGEYKNGGCDLSINYMFSDTQFGEILVASTSKGVCYMAFSDDRERVFGELKHLFPHADYEQQTDDFQQIALSVFSKDWQNLHTIKLHLKGTGFQLKVWETLLKIPMGILTTYGGIARHLDTPGASRAVGTAVGDNPVAFLIPCHRVIRSTGALGGYHWGLERKRAIIGWEAARIEHGGDSSD